jgi:hypothetical protein
MPISAIHRQGIDVDISNIYLNGSVQPITEAMARRTASAWLRVTNYGINGRHRSNIRHWLTAIIATRRVHTSQPGCMLYVVISRQEPPLLKALPLPLRLGALPLPGCESCPCALPVRSVVGEVE